jgi:serralysin
MTGAVVVAREQGTMFAMRRGLGLTALVALGFAVQASSAYSATVTVVEETSPFGTHSATLTYQAAPGEANRVTINAIEPDGFGGWIVGETGTDESDGGPGPFPAATLTAGAGCTNIDAQTAKCPSTLRIVRVLVYLDDRDDTASAAGACGYVVDRATLQCGPVLVKGENGNDVLVGNNVYGSYLSNIMGGPGDDTLYAGARGARLYGGDGNDRLVGGNSYDLLRGQAGDDLIRGKGDFDDLRGGTGNDILRAGLRHDRVRGGWGRDTIYARARDRDVIEGGQGFDRARVDVQLDRVTSIAEFF